MSEIILTAAQREVEEYMRPRGYNHFRNYRIEDDEVLVDVFMDGKWKTLARKTEDLIHA